MLVVASLACRRNPAAPSIELNLTPGMQTVTFVGPGPSSDPQIPPCTPAGVPSGGTSIATQVMLAHEGADWVARSPSPEFGSIELRFRPTIESDEGYLVSGSARGVAPDRGSNVRPPVDVTLTLAADGARATLVGTVQRSAVVVRGIISGAGDLQRQPGRAE